MGKVQGLFKRLKKPEDLYLLPGEDDGKTVLTGDEANQFLMNNFK